MNNLYFHYWPAKNGNASAPLIMWLQGGPGGSGLFGLWVEIGPYGIDAHGKAFEREFHWNDEYALLAFDQPVGTGYSYSDGGFENFARSQEEIGAQLYAAVQQFLEVFPAPRAPSEYLINHAGLPRAPRPV